MFGRSASIGNFKMIWSRKVYKIFKSVLVNGGEQWLPGGILPTSSLTAQGGLWDLGIPTRGNAWGIISAAVRENSRFRLTLLSAPVALSRTLKMKSTFLFPSFTINVCIFVHFCFLSEIYVEKILAKILSQAIGWKQIFKYSRYALTFEKLAALRYNLHTIKLNHLKHIVDGFDKYISSWNHKQGQDIELSHYPREFSRMPLKLIFFPTPRRWQLLICFLSLKFCFF